MLNGFTGTIKIIFEWCCSNSVTFGGVSFTFAEFFLFQILVGIVVWFICYLMYNR